ncbi:hypothetical protein CI610_03692 [invertebrate metagenome]|uniref:Uncharacterized protein n=1 Tax=invertebrate metagenome TaxID=1711999 RepID=A0A2H9T2E1_9ZZZZ
MVYVIMPRPCLEQVIEHRYMQSFDFKTKFNNYRNDAVEEKERTISSLALKHAILLVRDLANDVLYMHL